MKKIRYFVFVIVIINSCTTAKSKLVNEWNCQMGIIKYPKYTICTHTRDITYRQGGGRSGIFVYYVNGQGYQIWGPAYGKDKGIGDKFKIKYDSINPINAEVLIQEPVFLPGEKVVKIEGIVCSISNKSCYYKFTLSNGYVYEKLQIFYRGTRKKYPDLIKGAKFEVEYNPENPNHSIIYFDRPISL